MNISEKLKYYTENLNINFALKNIGKLLLLADEICRFIKKAIRGDRHLSFSSQELRLFVMAVEKVHKAVNKKCSFVEIRKRLEKHGKIARKELIEETHNTGKYISLARDLQRVLSICNYNATMSLLLEIEREQKKTEADDIFNDLVLMGIIEAM